MQATITYMLTEQAQRAQMAATGQPVARKQTATVEVSAEDLEYYPINPDGTINIDLTAYQHYTEMGKAMPSQFDATPDIPASIRAYRASKIERVNMILSHDAEMAAWLDSLTGEDVSKRHNLTADTLDAVGIKAEYEYNNLIDNLPPLAKAAQSRAIGRCELYRIAMESKRKQEEAAKNAAEEKIESDKLDYIASWIIQHADETTRAQFDECLLSRASALKLIADDLFESHGIPEKIELGETCRNSHCPCDKESVETLPRRIYPAWREMKTKLPEGSKATFRKVRDCQREDWDGDGESAGPAYYVADLVVPCGPFRFDRTVKLG